MVSRLAGGKALPADLLDRVLEKTDGVPLFVEELTKSILESARKLGMPVIAGNMPGREAR
jgi:predicted ATPase